MTAGSNRFGNRPAQISEPLTLFRFCGPNLYKGLPSLSHEIPNCNRKGKQESETISSEILDFLFKDLGVHHCCPSMLSVRFSAHISVQCLAKLSVHMSSHLPVHTSTHCSVHVSIGLPMLLSICPPSFLSNVVCNCLSMCPSNLPFVIQFFFVVIQFF